MHILIAMRQNKNIWHKTAFDDILQADEAAIQQADRGRKTMACPYYAEVRIDERPFFPAGEEAERKIEYAEKRKHYC